MLNRRALMNLANARVKDSLALFRGRRYHGAMYLCGYAIEYVLKARIAKVWGWPEYPPGGKGDFRSFITHDLDLLLKLCGQERRIKRKYLSQWSVVSRWKPEMRYDPVGSVKRRRAWEMIQAVQKLLTVF